MGFTEVGETVEIDVTDNDSDDSDTGDVSVQIDDAPDNGTAAVTSDAGEPVVVYTPNAGFDGIDDLGYEACVDSSCDSASITIYVGTSGCTIVGTDGDDVLKGTSGADIICGRDGDDTISGKGGADIIFGGRGADEIWGGGGPDVIDGGRGADTIDGGNGQDLIRGGRGDDDLRGSANDDHLAGGRGADILRGNRGNDVLIGKRGADEIHGNDGDDVLRGWRGDDTVDGGSGDDVLYGGRDDDVLRGGDGNDEIRGRRGGDQLFGEDGDDQLFGNRGDDQLDGGPGTDALDGGRHDDECLLGESYVDCEITDQTEDEVFCSGVVVTLLGTEGPDVLIGTPDTDVIAALGGDDRIEGLGGDDVVCGGAGVDTIFGGEGSDVIEAGDGDDVVEGGGGDDLVDGGAGVDDIDGGPGSDSLFGAAGNDVIVGGDDDDHLSGDVGDDDLSGGDGNDGLVGGQGDDIADGGPGADYCTTAEIVSNCEGIPTDPSTVDLFGGADEPIDAQAGTVTFEAPAGIDPVRVVMQSGGGLLATDVTLSTNYAAAGSLGDALVSPVYEFTLRDGAPGFTSAELTIPYRADFVGADDEADFRIARFDTNAGRWRVVPGSQTVDTAADTVTATITGFSTYAVIRYPSIEALVARQTLTGELEAVANAQNDCATPGGSYADVVLADNPVSYWRFGSADPLADEQGLNTLSGVPNLLPSLPPATSDGAVNFRVPDQPGPGADGFPGIANATGLFNEDFAIEYWLAQDGGGSRVELGGSAFVFTQIDVGGVGASLLLSDGTLLAFAGFQPVNFNHVVLEKDGDTVNFYVDGVLAETKTTNGVPVGFRGTHLTLPLLFNPAGDAGAIDEMAVYSQPLGQAEVTQHYNAGVAQAAVDLDDDDLLDCEEEAGLLTLGWINGAPIDDRDVFSIRLDPTDPDVDDDGLLDGEELIPEDLATTDLVTEAERQLLVDAGLQRIYRLRSFPTRADSDGDGTDDRVETINEQNSGTPGWDPLVPDVNDVVGLHYPRDTLFQPAAYGSTAFLNPVQNIRPVGPNLVVESLVFGNVVQFDANLHCVANCGPLNEFALGVVDEGLAEGGVIPCTFNDEGICDNLDDAARSRLQLLVYEQEIFALNPARPHGVDLRGNVIGAKVVLSCILFGPACANGDDLNTLWALPPLALTGATAPALRAQLLDRIQTETLPRVTDTGTGQVRRPSPTALRRWALYGVVGFSLLLQGDTSPTPQEAEEEVVRRTQRCLDVTSLPEQVAILSQLPQLNVVDIPNYGAVALDPCRSLPVYYPGTDVGQALTHRIDAIVVGGHPAVLSHQPSGRRGTQLGIPRRWFNIADFGPCAAAGLACDEYPNWASGESGPRTRLGQPVGTNQRTASLCLMSILDNGREGGFYNGFKGRNAMTVASGFGRFFLVIPDPLGLTTSRDVPTSTLTRVGSGSYPPPLGGDPDAYQGSC